MFIQYNPNPEQLMTDDCSVRALCKALDLTWDEAFALIFTEAFKRKVMTEDKAIIGSLLKANGFDRRIIENTCPDCYTFEDFCKDHPKGLFVLASGSHVAAVNNGDLFDAWDSSKEIPQYYWEAV